MRTPLLAVVLLASLLAACATATEDRQPVEAAPTTAAPTPAPSPPTTAAPTTTAPQQLMAPGCRPWDDGPVAPESAGLTAALRGHLDDPRLAGARVGVSVWVEGWGEVLAHHADERLLPASNQKLLTAAGVLEALPLATTLRTQVVATRAPDPATGVVDGDLVLVAGGDPTLSLDGDHSLASLAAAVRDAGVTEVRGALVVDESRYGTARSAPGWQDWHIPTYTGPLSPLVVDDNRGRADPAFLAEPALEHAEDLRDRLAAVGVAVAGPVRAGPAPAGATPVAGLDSAPLGELLDRMLLRSDNEVAESLTREAGALLTGDGSTPGGTAALAEVLEGTCAPLDPGGWGDGSGMSRADQRSPRELRRLLQHARTRPWWDELRSRLPVAARSGTLSGRFHGTAAEGRVAAKTGTIIGGASLTGVVDTAGGRTAFFSVLVEGDGAAPAMDALDELLVTVAGS
ncbi:D-alanyl-D-alanine carboxypeptidase/D-alanyl-D-alanine-endopeptidase [Iamia majanohamensis]|uniref:D-alanyl-D-alanine carboxypeptidase/D-alanyl-D-alanine-endopeptidase n=1 Tax=Iamia majanohamensis TaxID=467976 RepID=A0AAF0BVR6_9ACTN|nr:D-alanyl-D-alanine carboxypeptidase/D-alanyl-D-alanine-endopeptidase [Iamia majanohamensis]WCO67045.1 D-alanyl-D-alanine carboxypeptidase/D-alanyl-D-alanine-endopeptidase [Iamia majanohamensis]